MKSKHPMLEERNKKYFLIRKDYKALRERLLEIGGEEACFVIEEDEDEQRQLLERGKEWPKNAKLIKGEPRNCHGNSAELWLKDQNNVAIVTGWGLSKDGLWRQHTFCWNRRKKAVIETTERREVYFGYELSRIESAYFAFANCPKEVQDMYPPTSQKRAPRYDATSLAAYSAKV